MPIIVHFYNSLLIFWPAGYVAHHTSKSKENIYERTKSKENIQVAQITEYITQRTEHITRKQKSQKKVEH